MRLAQIRQLFRIIGGKPAPKGDSAFSDEGTPFIKMKDLGRAHFSNNLVDIDQRVSDAVAKKEGLNLVRRGSILLPRSGSVALNHRAVLGIDAYMVSHICALEVIDPKEVSSLYAYYYLRSIKMDRISKKTTGLDAITFEDLGKVSIPLPGIDDQIRIAYLLGKVEGLIAQRKQHLQQLDDLLNSVFLDMFGDPVRNEKGWPKRELGSAFKVKHGFAFSSDFFKAKGPFVLLTPGNFYEEGGFRDRGDRQRFYVGEAPDEFVLRAGSLLLAMTEQAPGLLGSPLVVPDSGLYLHNQRLGLIVEKEPIQSLFLFHLFNQRSVRQIIHSKATGTKVRHTSPTKIEAISVGYPPISLQNQFAAIVERIEALKTRYQESLTDLESLYSSLSQQAFKGELDLSRVALPAAPVEGESPVSTAVPAPTTAPVIELPETDLLLPALQDRTQLAPLLRVWLEAYRTQLGRTAFSLELFTAAAQTRLAELHPDNDLEWAASDYESIKTWVFEALAAGTLTQAFDDDGNRIELRAAAEQSLA